MALNLKCLRPAWIRKDARNYWGCNRVKVIKVVQFVPTGGRQARWLAEQHAFVTDIGAFCLDSHVRGVKSSAFEDIHINTGTSENIKNY